MLGQDTFICSDEGLTLETSAFESLYGGQLTLSTQLIKPNYLVILPPTQHHSFFRNFPRLYIQSRLQRASSAWPFNFCGVPACDCSFWLTAGCIFIFASAGVKRLNCTRRVAMITSPWRFQTAACQVRGVEVRSLGASWALKDPATSPEHDPISLAPLLNLICKPKKTLFPWNYQAESNFYVYFSPLLFSFE